VAEAAAATGRGWVLGPTTADGRLAVARQPVVVVDRGTGVGPALQLLLLDDDRSAAIEAAAAALGVGPAPEEGPPVQVTLSPATGDNHVVVATAGLGPEGGSETCPRGAAPDVVLGALTRRRLDAHPTWPHVHGGAVADSDGRAALVVGASGAGKSTLVAHLVASGLDLVTDEQVSLHRAEGLIGASTRPVAVKPGGLRHLPPAVADRLPASGHTQLVGAERLGAVHRVVARPVAVVVPERADSHSQVTTERLSPAEAVEVLAGNNLDLVRDPEEALAAFAWLACGVPVVRVRYRDAAAAVAPVRDLLASCVDVPARRWRVTTAPGAPPAGSAADPPAVVRARAGAVAVEVDDAVVVVEPSSRRLARLTGAEADGWATLPWPSVPEETPGRPSPLAVALDLLERGLVDVGRGRDVVHRRVPGLVSRRLRTEVLVADGQDRVARLDGAGAVVWDALAVPADRGEVVRRVLLDADPSDGSEAIDEDLVDDRVALALVQLEDAGLVEPDPRRRPAPDVRAG
jgi:hypothetical protein